MTDVPAEGHCGGQQKMRILHLITRMDGGGSAVNTLISATGQQRAGHEVVLAHGVGSIGAAEQEKVEMNLAAFRQLGGRVVQLEALQREIGWHDLRALRQILHLFAEGFDLIHTHTSKAGALGRLFGHRSAVVVHTPHGHVFHGYFGPLKTALFISIERLLARRSDALIALTRAERNDHLRYRIGRPEQWHVVPSGVDVQRISRQVAQLRRQGDSARWHAVSVGRLEPVKGMDRLISAWAVVLQEKPEARLAIVGDGAERGALEQQCHKLKVAHRVHFAGWTDPIPFLANAERFCLLSRNEGMGRAVVEAMAAGLPCIVSDVCGLTDLVDASVGLRVKAEDPEEVARALLADWDDKVSRQIRHRAEAYSVEAMLAGLEDVYQHVWQRRKGGA